MKAVTRAITVILGALSLSLPFILGLNDYYLFLTSLILLYTVIVMAWYFIGGLGGQLDIGAGAYHGLGAIVTGYLMVYHGVSGWIGLILSGLAAMGLAFLVGYPSFRFGLREVWYALASLGLVLILQKVFLLWPEVAGPWERYIEYRELDPLFMRAGPKWFYYYITLGLLAATMYAAYRAKNGKLGLYLSCVRDNEEAAEMLGIDTRRYKLKALLIYSFITALTGGIYASMVGFYHPIFFDPWIGIQTVTISIVGGLGHYWGPPLTSIILLSLAEYLRITLGGTIPGLHQVIFGGILLFAILFRPVGIGPYLETLLKRVSSK